MLGRQLAELGSLPWPEFERLLLPRVWQTIAGDIRLAEDRICAAPPSSPWARDARRYVDALKGSLLDSDLLLPESLRQWRTREQARETLKRQIRKFGLVLEAWPELFAAAKRLRERGVSLGEPLRDLT